MYCMCSIEHLEGVIKSICTEDPGNRGAMGSCWNGKLKLKCLPLAQIVSKDIRTSFGIDPTNHCISLG